MAGLYGFDVVVKPCPICGQTTEWSVGHSAECMNAEDARRQLADMDDVAVKPSTGDLYRLCRAAGCRLPENATTGRRELLAWLDAQEWVTKETKTMNEPDSKKCPECGHDLMPPEPPGEAGDDSYFCEGCGTEWTLDLSARRL